MKPLPFLLLAVMLSAGALPARAQTVAPVETAQGSEVWDSAGLAYKRNKNDAVTYDRELQKIQRRMNQNPPPGAPAVPETGRYNPEMFQHTHLRLKGEAAEQAKNVRIDRMIGLAELLDKHFRSDAWFQDKRLEEDLIREAKAKPGGFFDIVEGRLARRRVYIEQAQAAVLRYETGLSGFKTGAVITEAQAGTLALEETNARRWLSLSGLEAQAYAGRNLRDVMDPASEQGQLVGKAIDKADLSPDQKARMKDQRERLRARLEELLRVLETARKTLDASGDPDTAQAALSSTREELRGVSNDYRTVLAPLER